MRSIWSCEVFVVLHGSDGACAALDLESKFTEAALGAVQVSDFRNFGHGRHHWLAKHGTSTGVLALISNRDRVLAERTLRLLPPDVPKASLELGHDGALATLSGLVHVFHLTAAVGRVRGIDPGRPGVPSFGSKLYGLRAPPPKAVSAAERAIARKRNASAGAEAAAYDSVFWTRAHESFVARLKQSEFGGIIVDYDGTLCDASRRFTRPSDLVAKELTRFLTGGLLLGIATGRGISVQMALRAALPKKLWSQVWIGYYNAGHIARLSEPLDDSVKLPCEALLPVVSLLMSDELLVTLANVTPRRPQITVEAKKKFDAEAVLAIVQQRLALSADPHVRLVRSSHSLDILAPGVSKLALLQRMEAELPSAKRILCVGDRGQFPGNDFALLATPYSLSADEVSADATSCWNLAPPGSRGPSATLRYMKALVRRKSAWRFDIGALE
jgi:hypothetical protein